MQEGLRRGPKRLCYTAARTEVWMHLRINQINIARAISHPSVVPTLWLPRSSMAETRARGTRNATHYVSCIYRAHDYRACPVHVTSSFPKRYVLQHIAICSDIYRFTKHSFWLTTSQVSRTRLKLGKVTRELYSTWRWVQAATWIQPHNVFFFFFNETRTLEMLTCSHSSALKQTNRKTCLLSPWQQNFFTG